MMFWCPHGVHRSSNRVTWLWKYSFGYRIFTAGEDNNGPTLLGWFTPISGKSWMVCDTPLPSMSIMPKGTVSNS